MYYRRVIKIKAEDSPNVRLALAQIKAGREPTNGILVPGVLTYEDYVKRRQLWDEVRQCIGLDAEFYQGAQLLLFPPEWLNRAEIIASRLPTVRRGRAIGCDPAEGGDKSSWSVIDFDGLIEQVSMKTPDTSIIPERTIALMKQYEVSPDNVVFDSGGGGKQHADALRARGYNVRSVAFGEAASDQNKFRFRTKAERKEAYEIQYTYKNRRAEMYGILRQLLDPSGNPEGFGIPARFAELRRQLSPIPLWYNEGKLELPPKNKTKSTVKDMIGMGAGPTQVTLVDLIGNSPDEADSLVLAVFGLFVKPTVTVLSAAIV